MAAGGVGILAFVFYLAAAPRFSAVWREWRARYDASEGSARRALRRIAKTGDALATYRALEAWLHRLPRATEQEARGNVRFASLKQDLEQALFGTAARWTREKGVELGACADALRPPPGSARRTRREILPPLNPSAPSK